MAVSVRRQRGAGEGGATMTTRPPLLSPSVRRHEKNTVRTKEVVTVDLPHIQIRPTRYSTVFTLLHHPCNIVFKEENFGKYYIKPKRKNKN